MGYTITWDELEKICRKLNMERQGKTSVWKGTGSDGKMYLLRNQSGDRHLLIYQWLGAIYRMDSNNKSEVIMYQTDDGQTKIEVTFEDETAWLSLKDMTDLFQRDKSVISRHIKNIFAEGELDENSTVAFFATVQNEGDRTVARNVAYYNLDVIISVGYRVKSHRGTQFRIWATQRLKEYIIKGFTMNDELLKKAGGGNYFDELLARIRDIRASEKIFWRKVLDIYATSIDYDPRVEAYQRA